MANLYNVPSKNSVQHTLAGTLTSGELSTITLDSSVASELQASATMKGLLVVDRIDVNGNLTPLKTEYIAFTGVSGSTVTGLTRGLAGTSAQGHSIGAIVEFVPDVVWAQALNDVITTEHEADGTHKLNTFSNLNAPEGFLINGKIVPSVASNNLTVALKTLAGTDPSATDPIYVRIGGVVRTITSPLSLTANAGTNYLNLGSSEIATKHTDLFVSLCWNTTGATPVILLTRIIRNIFGNYLNNNTGDTGRITGGTTTGIDSFDTSVVIGRMEATLSAGAGYTWSVPTYTSENLIQRPIYETRWLSYALSPYGEGGSAGTFAQDTTDFKYKIRNDACLIQVTGRITNKGSWTGAVLLKAPMTIANAGGANLYYQSGLIPDNGNPNTSSRGGAKITSSTAFVFISNNYNANLTWASVVNSDTYWLNGEYQV